MGFKRSALLLEWPEDSEFSGLEVRMRRLSIGQLVKVQELSDRRTGGEVDTVKIFGELLDAIGDGLLSWNLEDDDGAPIPATREALDGVDVVMVLQLVSAWTSAAAAVPLASKPSLPTGEPAPPDDDWAQWLGSAQESPVGASPESSPAPV